MVAFKEKGVMVRTIKCMANNICGHIPAKKDTKMALLLKRPHRTLILLFLFAPLLLSACAPAVRNPLPLDQLTAQAAKTPLQEYRIQSGDLLDVKFYYNAELNEQITVRPDGRISLQLAGEIKAAGLTPAQLTDLLTRTYAPELKNPAITVIVRSFSLQRIYVDGEVYKPGLVNLVTPTTVLQSISQAGGLKDSARIDEIILIRQSADNKFTATMLNLEKALDGTDTKQDVILMPQDIIYVPKSHIANVNMWVDQYVRKNIPVTMGVGATVL
jgi:polysaccharide biosynthesis/export protein